MQKKKKKKQMLQVPSLEVSSLFENLKSITSEKPNDKNSVA